ncbi:hypothetical protein I7I53_11220 [Histoplasma capsulatum var. duboisii H88]|uniref:Uncharacterized protein n=1 Tax=Ajellomyces capsulatus (strain H88) TaxID=544711 RepID=A0A8A1L973_AJEC8|nr:hypothetical protein I7I53_11220 [Histoplasma capsulatum var. duboisii H88]
MMVVGVCVCVCVSQSLLVSLSHRASSQIISSASQGTSPACLFVIRTVIVSFLSTIGCLESAGGPMPDSLEVEVEEDRRRRSGDSMRGKPARWE